MGTDTVKCKKFRYSVDKYQLDGKNERRRVVVFLILYLWWFEHTNYFKAKSFNFFEGIIKS